MGPIPQCPSIIYSGFETLELSIPCQIFIRLGRMKQVLILSLLFIAGIAVEARIYTRASLNHVRNPISARNVSEPYPPNLRSSGTSLVRRVSRPGENLHIAPSGGTARATAPHGPPNTPSNSSPQQRGSGSASIPARPRHQQNYHRAQSAPELLMPVHAPQHGPASPPSNNLAGSSVPLVPSRRRSHDVIVAPVYTNGGASAQRLTPTTDPSSPVRPPVSVFADPRYNVAWSQAPSSSNRHRVGLSNGGTWEFSSGSSTSAESKDSFPR